MQCSLVLALGDLQALMGGLIVMTVLFFALITIIVVVVDKGSPLHKIIWMVLALLLPVISLILYFTIGGRTRNL